MDMHSVLKTAACIGITLLAGTTQAQDYPDWAYRSGWVDSKSVCITQNRLKGVNVDCSRYLEVAQRSHSSHWVGQIMEQYWDKDLWQFTRLKLRITWKTDRSPYDCGQMAEVPKDAIQDFKHRSIALKRCRL